MDAVLFPNGKKAGNTNRGATPALNVPTTARSCSTSLMQRLPFALIPAFFVPLIAMANITLLAQRTGKQKAVLMKSEF
jgi:hypothetical protein